MTWNPLNHVSSLDRKSAWAITRFTLSSALIALWCLVVGEISGQFIDPAPMYLLAAGVTAAFAVKLGERPGGASLGRLDEAAGMIVLAGIVRMVGVGFS